MPSGDNFRLRTECSNGHPYTEESTNRTAYRSGKVRFCRICDRERKRKAGEKCKREVLAEYGGKCAWPGCEVTDPDVLNLDHIHDDGKDDRHPCGNRRAGVNTYFRVKREGCPKDRYQILCANHNLKKEILRRRALRGEAS